MLLEGRTAIVTGGSRGIGFQISKIFLEEGARVLAISRSVDKLAGATAALQGLETLVADTTKPDAIDRAVAWTHAHWGTLDILVNNAGVLAGHTPDLTAVGDDDFIATNRTNLLGPYLTTKRFLPLLLTSTSPRVLNIGSSSGVLSPRLRGAYGVSKAGLHALTIATSLELEGRVALNVLSPGWVRTDMAPDAPDEPRMSAEAALQIVTMPREVTGRLFHATPNSDRGPAIAVERAWAEF